MCVLMLMRLLRGARTIGSPDALISLLPQTDASFIDDVYGRYLARVS